MNNEPIMSKELIISRRMSRKVRGLIAACGLAALTTTALLSGVKVARSEPAAQPGNAAALAAPGASTAKQQDEKHIAERSQGQAAAPSVNEFERRVTAVYEHAGPAIVRVGWTAGKIGGGGTGVIVTAEGHVLLPAFPSQAKLAIQLPDGRAVTGSALGWSDEWNIGLAKIEAPGPWPHVELGGSAGIKSGQSVVTLFYTVSERPDIVPRPLLGVDWVNRSAKGLWFMTADTLPLNWNRNCIAFDTSGHLVGVASARYPSNGSIYTAAELIETLWDDLVAGKNLDLVRLAGQSNVAESDRRDPVAKTTIEKEVDEKATAASVHIRRQPDQKGFSGAIISEDGVVATCAHHFIMPGTKVIVSLSDGRDVAGEVLGISFPCDVGLVRITDPGPFPHVEMGDSTRLRPGDPCLVIGYGPVDAKARQPRVRTASVVEPPGGRWSCKLHTNAETAGGDSGGGAFDADGNLIGILHGGASHKRVELFHKHWDELHATLDQSNASGLAFVKTDIQQAAQASRRSVVEVLDGEKPVALGTIVSVDGRILTKASMLPEVPHCRLSDGRVLPATVIKTVRAHDLAVLKIDAVDLRPVDLSETVAPPVGTLVAAVADSAVTSFGCISHPALSFPSERGWLRARLQDSKQGLEVVELHDMPEGGAFATFGPQLLRKGDVIVSIDDHPTPNREACLALLELDIEKKDPLAIAGDSVRLSVVRDGKPAELGHVLGPPNGPRFAGQSARCSGFAKVYSVTATAESSLCGGPVVDRLGHLIGVAIAWRHSGWLLVLPAAIAKTVASD